jgi:hypothetical protein
MTRRQWRRSLAAPPRQYVIAFNAYSGYRTIEHHPWRSWLGWRDSAILTLQRI